jgi:hypothetical protein
MHKIKEKTYTYLTTISIPGVPAIFTSNNFFLKIFSSLLMLGLIGVGFWNIALAVNDYYNYDVTSNIKSETSENVVFPAITTCLQVYSISKKTYNKSNDELINDRDGYEYKGRNDEFKIFLQSAFFCYNNNKCDLIPNDELETFKIVGTDLLFLDSKYCFRFNADSNTKKQQLYSINSSINYFEIRIWNDPENKFYNDDGETYSTFSLRETVDLYVYVTDNSLNSFIYSAPANLKLRNSYKFKINRFSVETKLQEPYNKCTDKPYIQMNCIEECIHKQIQREYNCTFSNTLFTIKGVEECSNGVRSYDWVFYSYANKYNDICASECSATECSRTKFYFDTIDSNNYLQEMELRFSFRDLGFLNMTQNPKIDHWTFINNIGGGLGLFMGLAFPNFIEFFQFIADILIIIIYH